MPLSVGWVVLVLGWWCLCRILRRQIAPLQATPDTDKLKAWGLLIFILGVGLWLRMYGWDQPLGIYNEDPAEDIITPLNMLEFSEHAWVFFPGAREPLYTYLVSPFINIFPNAPLFIIQRVFGAVLGTITIWLFYLVGAYMVNRRVGVSAAALASISKPLILTSILGYRHVTLPFVLSIFLVLFVMNMKHSKWGTLLICAVALAAGNYTYTAFRILFPFFTFLPLLEAFQKDGRSLCNRYICPSFIWLYAAFSICAANGGENSFLYKAYFSFWGVSIICAIFVLGWISLRSCPKVRRATAFIVVSYFLSIPIFSQSAILDHANSQWVFSLTDVSQLKTVLKSFGLEAVRTLSTFFFGGPDRQDFSLRGDSFLDFPTLSLFILGSAFLSIKRARPFMQFIVAIVFCLLPHMFSSGFHSGKLLGTVPFTVLLGAWGATLWWNELCQRVPRLIAAVAMAIPWLLFLWSAFDVYQRVYDDWIYNPAYQDVGARLYHQVEKSTNRDVVFVDVSDHYQLVTQQALSSSKKVRIFQDRNDLIPLADGTCPNIIVIFPNGPTSKYERLKREYPTAEFHEFRGGKLVSSGIEPILERVSIPAATWASKTSELFCLSKNVASGWIMEKYEPRCGLGRGLITSVNWWPRSNEIDSTYESERAYRVAGSFGVEIEGPATFEVTLEHPMRFVLKVDETMLFDEKRTNPKSVLRKTVELTKGVHRLESLWVPNQDTRPPRLTIRDTNSRLPTLFECAL